MIFENDFLHSKDYKNNFTEDEFLLSNLVNNHSSFLIKSLKKIKISTKNIKLKEVLSIYIEEFNSIENKGQKYNLLAENELDSIAFSKYAKSTYFKVLHEENRLKKLLCNLEIENDYLEISDSL